MDIMKSMMTLADRAIVRVAKAERKLAKSEAKLQDRKGKVEAARKNHQAALDEAEQLGRHHSEPTPV